MVKWLYGQMPASIAGLEGWMVEKNLLTQQTIEQFNRIAIY